MNALERKVYRYIQASEQRRHGPVPTVWILGGDRYAAERFHALKRLEARGDVVLTHDPYGWSEYSTVIRPDGAA